MKNELEKPTILLIEDDPDQMSLMTQLTLIEVNALKADRILNDEQLEKLNDIQILKIGDLQTLGKACSNYQNVIFSLVDCNIPDDKASAPHDQFVKTNHLVTGQHRSVDLICQCAPNAPIILTSSMNRFQRLVIRYYDDKSDVLIRFVSKRDKSKLSKYLAKNLRAYLGFRDNKASSSDSRVVQNDLTLGREA